MRRYISLHTFIIIGSVFAAVLQGCVEDSPGPTRKAVIEGYFRCGEHPTVIFSSSVVPAINGNIADAVVNWGKVTLSDGDTTVVLTGRVDDSYMPPFIYYTFDMTGIPGKTYSISAEFKDLKAHASATILPPVKIDSITMAKTDNDSLRAATLHFTSPEMTPAYFYISMKKNERGAVMHPCMMSAVRTDRANTHYSVPLLRPRIKIDSTRYVSQLLAGEEWIVSFNRVEESVYDFWKSYDDMVMFSNSPFISTSASLPSNIAGGYGIWSAEGSDQLTISVK